MLTTDPRDALVLADACARRLREQAAAERLRGATRSRCPLAALLRRVNRAGGAPLVHRPA